MAVSKQTPSRRGGRYRVPNFALIASLFLHPSHTAPASAAAVAIPVVQPAQTQESPHLHRRIDGEHVVLADCRDSGGVVSSQMAYFLNEPGATPQDVAVVVTTPGQAALWVNTNTSGLFTDTGVTFTATLGPRVADGQFAGTGENGYGNFSCYQRYVKELYTYARTTCSQVYECDHSDPPDSVGSSSGMSQGSVIGIAVGVAGGVLFLVAAALVFWYYRRSRRDEAARSRHSGELLRAGTMSTGVGSEAGEPKPQTEGENQTRPRSQPVIQQMSAVYEMDGRLFRVEMANENGKFELDPAGHGSAELEIPKGEGPTGNTTTESTESKAVSPLGEAPTTTTITETEIVSPLSPDSPGHPAIPQSPPPEYSPPKRTGGE